MERRHQTKNCVTEEGSNFLIEPITLYIPGYPYLMLGKPRKGITFKISWCFKGIRVRGIISRTFLELAEIIDKMIGKIDEGMLGFTKEYEDQEHHQRVLISPLEPT